MAFTIKEINSYLVTVNLVFYIDRYYLIWCKTVITHIINSFGSLGKLWVICFAVCTYITIWCSIDDYSFYKTTLWVDLQLDVRYIFLYFLLSFRNILFTPTARKTLLRLITLFCKVLNRYLYTLSFDLVSFDILNLIKYTFFHLFYLLNT